MTTQSVQVTKEQVDLVSQGLLELKESRKAGVKSFYLPDMVISQAVTELASTLSAQHSDAPLLSKGDAKKFKRVYEERFEFYRTLARRSDELLAFAYSATRKLSAEERHIILFALGLSGMIPKSIKINLRDFLCMGRSLRHKQGEAKGADGYAQVGATLPFFFASPEFNALMGGVHTRSFYKALLAIRKKMSEHFQMGIQQLCARITKKKLSNTRQWAYSIFDVLSQFDRNYLTYFSGLRNYCYHMMRTVEQEKRAATLPAFVDGEPVRALTVKIPPQWLTVQEAKFFADFCEENKVIALPEARVTGDTHLCSFWSFYKRYRGDSNFSLVSFLDRITAENAERDGDAAHWRAQELEKLRALRVATLLAQRIAVVHKPVLCSPSARRIKPEMRSVEQAAIQIYLSDIEKLLHALKAAIQTRAQEQDNRVLYDFTAGFSR